MANLRRRKASTRRNHCSPEITSPFSTPSALCGSRGWLGRLSLTSAERTRPIGTDVYRFTVCDSRWALRRRAPSETISHIVERWKLGMRLGVISFCGRHRISCFFFEEQFLEHAAPLKIGRDVEQCPVVLNVLLYDETLHKKLRKAPQRSVDACARSKPLCELCVTIDIRLEADRHSPGGCRSGAKHLR